jgi:hypothetical protein
MRNLIFAALLSVVCVPTFAGNCTYGSCGSRVATATRTVVTGTVGVCRRVVSAPVNAVRRVRSHAAVRRTARRSRLVARSCGC